MFLKIEILYFQNLSGVSASPKAVYAELRQARLFVQKLIIRRGQSTFFQCCGNILLFIVGPPMHPSAVGINHADLQAQKNASHKEHDTRQGNGDTFFYVFFLPFFFFHIPTSFTKAFFIVYPVYYEKQPRGCPQIIVS